MESITMVIQGSCVQHSLKKYILVPAILRLLVTLLRQDATGERQEKMKDEPSQHDVAVHGASVIYKLYIIHLHTSRERVRAGLFYDLGFLRSN